MNFEWPTLANMNILYMRTQILCHRIEKKINQKLRSTFPVAQCLIAPPFSWWHFYLILNEIKVSLNRNGLIFKKVTTKILNEYHIFQWTRCRHFHKWHVAKIRGQHRVTLHNYKATRTSLLINEKSKSTFTTQLPPLPPDVSPASRPFSKTTWW
jgi:hypothetical protein